MEHKTIVTLHEKNLRIEDRNYGYALYKGKQQVKMFYGDKTNSNLLDVIKEALDK